MNKNYITSKLLKIFNIICILLMLASCGIYRSAPVSEVPVNDKDKRKKNMEEGRGITLFKNDKAGGGNFVFASSNPMWRATLSTLDFTPLSNVDYSGGIIITDWYSDESDEDRSIKISVTFLANEIRADGIEVDIFERNCNQNQNCITNKINSELNQEIKVAILKRAAQIEKGDKKREFEESGKKVIFTGKEKN
jgi:hypothetical protein